MSNPWTVLVIALLVLALRVLLGTWRASSWLWLALLVLLGMIPPLTPIMVGIGGLVLFMMVLRNVDKITGATRTPFLANLRNVFPH